MKFFKLQATLVGLYALATVATPVPGPELTVEEHVTLDVDLPSGGTITRRSLLNVEGFKACPLQTLPSDPSVLSRLLDSPATLENGMVLELQLLAHKSRFQENAWVSLGK